MKISLLNTFAVLRFFKLQEFHLRQLETNIIINPYSSFPMTHKSKKTTSPILLFHTMIFIISACPKHYTFRKVKVPYVASHNEVQIQSSQKMSRTIQMLTRKDGPTVLDRNPTTSILIVLTSIWAYGAGITATDSRLALRLILLKNTYILLIPMTRYGCSVLLFLVTTSLCRD